MTQPIQIFKYETMKQKDVQRIMNRSVANYDQIAPKVKVTMEEIKKNGDKAIITKYKERKIPIIKLMVSKREFEKANKNVSNDFKKALDQVINNINLVNSEQIINIKKEKVANVLGKDIIVWREWRAIDTVGIYVPGGNANYPSSLLMCAIPAIVAGCKEIIVCCPPDKNGNIPDEVIVAAQKVGITKIFKVGGPQAIAAMAYGTETIPKVQIIVGPGNNYVTIAKLLVYPQTTIDMPAGPSENLIIADECANPEFVAADLLTDSEHGIDSTAVLLTQSPEFAGKVAQEIEIQLSNLSTGKTIEKALNSYGAIIVFNKNNTLINFANEYAPEHMQIMTCDSLSLAKLINNAGSVFIGPWSTKSSGDYATGANHVLPTGKMAKTFGPLSVENFGRLVQFQKVTKNGLKNIRQSIITFAEVEKLPAHKNSTEIRFKYPLPNY